MNEREQTTIQIPAVLLDKLKRKADGRGYPANDLIIFILWTYYLGDLHQDKFCIPFPQDG